MPYTVRKSNGGYKVRSINGTELSKKPLSRKKAYAQKKAVEISEKLRKA